MTTSGPQPSYTVRVVGAQSARFRDVYHAFLRSPWWAALMLLVGAYLALNALFAVGFLWSDGVAHATPGSFRDAFFFSVQTMGTVGYGAMFPESPTANALVVAESVVGMLFTALATGLVFAKFSQPQGRIAFSRTAVVSPLDGVPTLMFRVGNERGNFIVEATVRVTQVRTVRTREGVMMYRMTDIPLVRDRTAAMTRSWNVMHTIDERSPLYGKTPEELAAEEFEFVVSLTGIDDTSYQLVHARRTYEHTEILWGARHADVLSETSDGNLVLDVRRFHDTVATEPTESFPYPRPGG